MSQILLLIIIFLPLLGGIFVVSSYNENKQNAVHVAILTILSNVFLILRLFADIETQNNDLQALTSFVWPILPRVNIIFGIDITALSDNTFSSIIPNTIKPRKSLSTPMG